MKNLRIYLKLSSDAAGACTESRRPFRGAAILPPAGRQPTSDKGDASLPGELSRIKAIP
jgi:hypothetical protein